MKDQQGKSRGFAFVGFKTDEACAKAVQALNGTYLGSSKVIVDFAKARTEDNGKASVAPSDSKKARTVVTPAAIQDEDSTPEPEVVAAKPLTHLSDLDYLRAKSNATTAKPEAEAPKAKNSKKNTKEPAVDAAVHTASNRLRVKNLPYDVDESTLRSFLTTHCTFSDLSLPSDGQKGYALVTFETAEEATRAASSLKNASFQGRLVDTVPLKSRPDAAPASAAFAAPAKLPFKQMKELATKAREAAGVRLGWNASHVRGDAVVDSLAERLGVQKQDLIDARGQGSAVRVATAFFSTRSFILNPSPHSEGPC